jgi:hypothetical protein
MDLPSLHFEDPTKDALKGRGRGELVGKKKALIAAYSNAESKAHRIKEFDPNAPDDEVADIFHLTLDKARELRDDLRACIPGIKEYVLAVDQRERGD